MKNNTDSKKVKDMSSDELTQLLEKKEIEERLVVAARAPVEDLKIQWAVVKTTMRDDVEIQTPVTRLANTVCLLEHYDIVVRYNQMAKEVEIDIPNVVFNHDTQANDKMIWFKDIARNHGLPVTDLCEHIEKIAGDNTYHPVVDWIKNNPWDGESRMQQYYDTIQSSDVKMKEFLMRKWGIQAVAAAFSEKGIHSAGVLVFSGKQGMGKTRWLPCITGHSDWVLEGEVFDPTNKDSVMTFVAKWIVEMGEIQATFRRADIDKLKSFITKAEDTIRPAYARKLNKYARRTVFFGTVDEGEFLSDQNGNRRFWTVEVDKINNDHQIDTQQLWAEFYHLYTHGERFWMDADEIEQLNTHNKRFLAVDPVWEMLASVFEAKRSDTTVNNTSTLNATELVISAGIRNPSKAQTNSAGKWLRDQGAKFLAHDRKWVVYQTKSAYKQMLIDKNQ